jgi:hypothetical protein
LDSDSEDHHSIDEAINICLENGQQDSSTTAFPILPPKLKDDSIVLHTIMPTNAVNLGAFDMLESFPNSLISMTRIIHYCPKVAVPLYLIYGFF